MTKTWLILDCDYLCHRAHHTAGVLYGFLRDIPHFMQIHQTKNIVFCWDHGEDKRRAIYPAYKGNRKPKSYSERVEMAELKYNMELLKRKILKDIGFINVFYHEGYEADDIIASVVDGLAGKDEAVMISADKDLYQLLGGRIVFWNPTTRKPTTDQSFHNEYGIWPEDWVFVKAIAGCSGDNIRGIKGIGELSVCKYLCDELKPTSAKYKSIKAGLAADSEGIVERNEALVTIPFPGTPKFKLQDDDVTPQKWNDVVTSYGLDQIKGAYGALLGY